MRTIENSILSTDMGLYFKKKNTFLELSDNGEFDWQSPDKKDRKWTQNLQKFTKIQKDKIYNILYTYCYSMFSVLCGMMMTACDVSAIAKPWEIQHKVAKLVADEFFEQGDLEKLKLNQEPIVNIQKLLLVISNKTFLDIV